MTKGEETEKALAAIPMFTPEKIMKDRDVCTQLVSLIDGLTTKVENFTLPK